MATVGGGGGVGDGVGGCGGRMATDTAVEHWKYAVRSTMLSVAPESGKIHGIRGVVAVPVDDGDGWTYRLRRYV